MKKKIRKLKIGTKVKINSPIAIIKGIGIIAQVKKEKDYFDYIYRLKNLENMKGLRNITENNGQVWVNDFEIEPLKGKVK